MQKNTQLQNKRYFCYVKSIKSFLPEEEASNIAFHLINAQSASADNQDGLKKAKLIGIIVNLVRYSIQQDVNTNSIHYSRFITHVRFFVDRFFTEGLLQRKRRRTVSANVGPLPKCYGDCNKGKGVCR